jgi:hypothetical protein
MAGFVANFGSMAVHIGPGRVPEQRIDPPCLGAEHEEILDQIDEAKKERNQTSNMMDAWADFSAELAGIDAPETIIALVDRLRAPLENWANSRLGAQNAALADLSEREYEMGQPWK